MTNSSNDNVVVSIKEKLIDMIHNDPDLPTLGNSISKVVQLTGADEQPLEQLSNFILSDPSLTLKILRLANSITYRSTAAPVTSISTAIQLLGMDTIKACALAMMLVDGMPGKHAKAVRNELLLAFSASLIARNLAKHSAYQNAEEVAIAALFKNIGRVIVAAYDDELYWETMVLSRKMGYTEARASSKRLGCTFNWLTVFALRAWHIPDTIILAMKLLPTKVLKPPKNRSDWMQQVTEFSNHAALMTLCEGTSTAALLAGDLLKRYGESLRFDADKLNELINESIGQVHTICSHALNVPIDEDTTEHLYCFREHTDSEDDLANCSIFESTGFAYPLDDCHLNGRPLNAVDQLLSGVQDVSAMLVSNQDNMHAILMLVLETFYRALGFQFVTACLKDVRTGQFRARHSFGLDHEKKQGNFVFSNTDSNDLFSIALKRNVDLSILDATNPKIHNALPDWHKQLLPETKSFMLLPLVINQNTPIGLIYADRIEIAQESITTQEMKLIKALKAQLLVALKHD